MDSRHSSDRPVVCSLLATLVLPLALALVPGRPLMAGVRPVTPTPRVKLQSGQPKVSQVVLKPTRVTGGQPANATIWLDGVAPAEGTVIRLASSHPRVASVPERIQVPRGQRNTIVQVKTTAPRADVVVRIKATANGSSHSAELRVGQLPMAELRLDPAVVTGGVDVTGTVRLVRPAPKGGAAIQIFANGPIGASHSGGFTIPEGATTGTFRIATETVRATAEVQFYARYDGQTISALLTILPVRLLRVEMEPERVVGGRAAAGRVFLSHPAPAGGALCLLSSGVPGRVRVPASVRVPEGAKSAPFSIRTTRVSAPLPVLIAAAYAGVAQSATLEVLPAVAVSIAVRPERITGGLAAVGTVRLRDPAPLGGAVIALSSSRPLQAAVPATLTVPAGAAAVSFAIETAPAARVTTVLLRATYRGTTLAAALTVLPSTPRDTTGQVTVIPLVTNDLGYDAVSGRIYASTPMQPLAKGGAIGPSITWLDPFTGALGSSIPLGEPPGRLAISDDGRALYVAVDGGAAVRRVDTVSETAELRFSLGSDPHRGVFLVEELAVLPGDATSVAIARRNQNGLPRHEGVAIYDNGVPRSQTAPHHTGSNLFVFSTSASRLYGYNTEGENGFRRMTVDEAGVSVVDTTRDLMRGQTLDIRFEDGLIYTSAGQVVDPEARTLAGQFPGIEAPAEADVDPPALVCPDGSTGRAFFLTGRSPTRTLLAFDLYTRQPLAMLSIPGVQGTASRLLRWGADGLAFRTSAGQLFLIRTGIAVRPALSLHLDPATTPGGLTVTGTVTLSSPAPPSGLTVTLTSEEPDVARVSSTVTVPGGATAATFPVRVLDISCPTFAAVVSAHYADVHREARLRVFSVIRDLALRPSSVVGGGTVMGELGLACYALAGGVVITLASDRPDVAAVPERLEIAEQEYAASFPVTTRPVSAPTTVTLTITLHGRARTLTLQVLPP